MPATSYLIKGPKSVNAFSDSVNRSFGKVYSYRKKILLALIWVVFLMFFTYTGLCEELLLENGDFPGEFYKLQSRYVTFFVNAGIIGMLLFDNYSNGIKMGESPYIVSLIGLMLCFAIFAHSGKEQVELENFIYPLKFKELSLILYGVFLLAIFWLKVRSLIGAEIPIEQKKGVKSLPQ